MLYYLILIVISQLLILGKEPKGRPNIISLVIRAASLGRCNFTLPGNHSLKMTGGRDWTKGRMDACSVSRGVQVSKGRCLSVMPGEPWIGQRGWGHRKPAKTWASHHSPRQRSLLFLCGPPGSLGSWCSWFWWFFCIHPCFLHNHVGPIRSGRMNCSGKHKLCGPDAGLDCVPTWNRNFWQRF